MRLCPKEITEAFVYLVVTETRNRSMDEKANEPLAHLVFSLIGLSVMITACSIFLIPYHTFRWLRGMGMGTGSAF